jgi:hypothetical protein
MKEIIRMNQLAGIITEGQARKMIAILNENFKVGQAIKSVEGEDAEILKISTYDKNKKAIDSSIAQSGWEPQSGTPKEELTWYLVDNGNYQEWYDEEELSTNNKNNERNN